MSMDDVQVDRWRAEQFDRMGFEPTQVAVLLRWNVDLGSVRGLVAAGCPLNLVMRIVRPLDEAPIPLMDQAEQYSVKV